MLRSIGFESIICCITAGLLINERAISCMAGFWSICMEPHGGGGASAWSCMGGMECVWGGEEGGYNISCMVGCWSICIVALETCARGEKVAATSAWENRARQRLQARRYALGAG